MTKPRTKHVKPDGSPQFTNRLKGETSPYLLQHAHNPVDWYPWGDEAFDKARKENKPIFLSIGYSTCHWCHVMEEESFEDLEIAQYLNENYVAIKVDREERPDLDAVYMAAVQMITGHGGWPMSVWLNADRTPYYGGTYFPPRDGDRGAHMGFLSIVKRLRDIYASDPDRVALSAKEISETLKSATRPAQGMREVNETLLHEVYDSFAEQYDATFGGFGHAPKFPRPSVFQFLFQYGRRNPQSSAHEMALSTLTKMSLGGMYDQIGGGFHRYSTDRFWLVPHFEKMLYDNAQLVVSFLEAFQITHEDHFQRIAAETLDYLDREMSDSKGGFHSATDADSEGEEGTFFVWSMKEIESLLGSDFELLKGYYGLTPEGNFEGKNILAVSQGVDSTDWPRLLAANQKLYEVRSKRIPPLKDDKVLTAWNGLAITAFSRGAFVLHRTDYLDRAKRAANFILTELRQGGELFRSYRNGKAQISAFVEDYAFLIQGLLALFEASGEAVWLKYAIELQGTQQELFWDATEGGYFMSGSKHETLLTKEKPYYDGAEPSANSVSALNLLRLEALTGEEEWGRLARKTLQAFSSVLEKAPSVAPLLAAAVDFSTDRSKEVVLISSEGDSKLVNPMRGLYLPNTVLIRASNVAGELGKFTSILNGKSALNGAETAFVCEKGACQLPTQNPQEFVNQLTTVHSYQR